MDFSTETLWARREQQDVFEVLKSKPAAEDALHSAAVIRSWRRDGLPGRLSQKELVTTEQAL